MLTTKSLHSLTKLFFIIYRKGPQGPALASANTPKILDANNFKDFWISWTGGEISVGEGTSVGNRTFMTYKDFTPSAVNYLAFSGWDTPGIVYINYGLYRYIITHNV